MALDDSSASVLGDVGGGEEVLPKPVVVGVGIFFIEGVGEVNCAKAAGEVLAVDGLYLEDVLAQRGDEAVGEHGESVIAAFAVSDDDLVIVKVHVFDTQPETFHEAESGAIEDLRHEFVNAVEVGDNGADFIFGENSRDSFIFLWAEGGEGGLVEGDFEDVAVEEEDGAKRLILGGFGDFSFDNEVGDELVDFVDGHLAGVDGNLSMGKVGVVVTDVFADPFQVGLFGAGGVLFYAELVAILVEEFFCRHKYPSVLGKLCYTSFIRFGLFYLFYNLWGIPFPNVPKNISKIYLMASIYKPNFACLLFNANQFAIAGKIWVVSRGNGLRWLWVCLYV
jgi:hypothetical protein